MGRVFMNRETGEFISAEPFYADQQEKGDQSVGTVIPLTEIYLNDGRVDAIGTHDELLEASSWYRETWDRQRAQEELEELG